MYRLAYIVTHPIQYQAPLLRLIAASGEIDLKVFFLSDFSLQAHHEAAFGQTFKWDVNLTDGYAWELLPRLGIGPTSPMRPWWPVQGLKERLARGNFNAVWVHGWAHIGLRQAARTAHALGLPLLMRGETSPGSSRAVGLKRWLRDRHLQKLFNQTAAFLCIGTRNREFYQQYAVPASKQFLVPYAVDNQMFQARSQAAAAQRDSFRRELGLEPGRPVILFAAKFIPVKAPGDLLSAYQRLWGTAPSPVLTSDLRPLTSDPSSRPWPVKSVFAISPGSAPRPYLLFVGDGPLRGGLMAQAGAQAGGDVRFLGFRNQSELPALYDLCDVFVLPSNYEPWGLVINEVMNARKPVIVSACVGAAPDLVKPGVNGWSYPTGDVAALAECLRQAFADADLPAMGQQSLELINRWDFQADLNGLLAALRSVAPGGKSNGR